MTMDSEIIVWCIAAPLLVTAVACVVAQLLHSRRAESRWVNVVVALGWWIAVVIALTARHGWQWWPEDAWRQAVWPLLAWAVVFSSVTSQQLCRPWVWVMAGGLAIATALIAMPGGDQWSDIYPLHRVWMCAVSISCLLNGFAMYWMAEHGAKRWVLLVALTGPAGSLLLAGSAYGSLAEWMLAVIAATICVAVWNLLPTSINAWVVALPAFAAAASVTAAARFYTYEEISPWVYGAVLLGPTLIAVIDACVLRVPSWLRVTISGCVSMTLLGLCVWAVLLS